MNRRHILILAPILILALGGYFWYSQKPEQKINSIVDTLIENVEHRKISLRTKDTVEQAVKPIFADKVAISGSSPVPNSTHTREEICEQFHTFHNFTTVIEVTEISRELQIIGKEAQVILEAKIFGAAGKQHQGTSNWTLVIDLAISPETNTWQITAIDAKKQ